MLKPKQYDQFGFRRSRVRLIPHFPNTTPSVPFAPVDQKWIDSISLTPVTDPRIPLEKVFDSLRNIPGELAPDRKLWPQATIKK